MPRKADGTLPCKGSLVIVPQYFQPEQKGLFVEVRDGKCRIELADTFMTPWIPEEHLRKLEFW